MRPGLRAGCLAALVVLLASCGGGGGDDPEPPVQLASIAIQPGSASTLEVGATLQYQVVASYSDGSTRVVTTSATLSSSNTSIAEINGSGLATARAPGTITVSATFEGRTSSATLNIPATLIWDNSNWGDFDWG